MTEYVEIEEAELLYQNDKGGMFLIDEEEVWLWWDRIEENPGSPSKNGEVGTIYVDERFAKQQGII